VTQEFNGAVGYCIVACIAAQRVVDIVTTHVSTTQA